MKGGNLKCKLPHAKGRLGFRPYLPAASSQVLARQHWPKADIGGRDGTSALGPEADLMSALDVRRVCCRSL